MCMCLYVGRCKWAQVSLEARRGHPWRRSCRQLELPYVSAVNTTRSLQEYCTLNCRAILQSCGSILNAQASVLGRDSLVGLGWRELGVTFVL